jgi:hypothetical protein
MIPESELYPDIGMEPTQAGSVSSGKCQICGKTPEEHSKAQDLECRITYWQQRGVDLTKSPAFNRAMKSRPDK